MVPEVEVRVLGPVEVRGADRPFSRARALELVVYLALHPEGVGNDGWATALWPDRLPAPATLHSTVSAARRALGVSSSGLDHLPRGRHRLQLAATVTTDWWRFVRLAGSGQDVDAAAALRLVRGPSFGGLRNDDWTLFEGFRTEIEQAVGRVAAEAGNRALDRRRPDAARAAARRGLVVSPYDERLFRILMRAADLEANIGGVRAVMAELAGTLSGERLGPGAARRFVDSGEVADLVHPETYLLYRTLTNGLGRRRGGQLAGVPATGGRVATL